jgi:hypothetical protein
MFWSPIELSVLNNGKGDDLVVLLVSKSTKLLYKDQTRMNDRMWKMKPGLVLVERLFFVLVFEDEAINGNVVSILPNCQRRVRWGPALNIEVQLEATTILFVLKEEYGGKGAG